MHYSDQSLTESRICIVDDNEVNIRLVEQLFEFSGFHNYLSISDSRMAVATIADYEPDIVLLDLHMPHVDGYQVMEQLKQIIPEDVFLPIVVLVFNLWFLLLLKFCIPPSVAVDAGLAAAVEGGLDIDASFSLKIDAQLDGCLGVEMRNKLKAEAGGDLNVLAKMAVDLNSDFMPSAPPDLVPDLVPYTPPTPPAKAKTLPSAAARLQYYERVEAPV